MINLVEYCSYKYLLEWNGVCEFLFCWIGLGILCGGDIFCLLIDKFFVFWCLCYFFLIEFCIFMFLLYVLFIVYNNIK